MSDISAEEVFDRLPTASIDRDSIAFFRGMLQSQLLLNRCHDCGHWFGPTWPICPECWSDDIRPTEVSGKGTIHSFTLLHAGLPAPGIDYVAGYPVALIDLDEQEGLRAAATIVDCPNDALEIGMPVQLAWTERDGQPFPAFRPVAETDE